MALNEREAIYLSAIEPVMTDQQFESLLVGKSENTTIPYMRRAKELVVRGLLTTGTDRKQINERKKIIAGSYTGIHGVVEGRVFLIEDEDKVTLLWKGPLREFRRNYMRIRDELAGKVPYRKYGRAAALENQLVMGQRLSPACIVSASSLRSGHYGHPASANRIKPIRTNRSVLTPAGRTEQAARYAAGDPRYDAFVHEVLNCEGGCSRGAYGANPMLRPAGGFRLPSPVMFVLEQPTEQDDRENRCLTMGPEDYKEGKPDQTAQSLQKLLGILGMSYKDIYIINSLLCWQFRKASDFERCWLPCLSKGWLARAIAICNPWLIVTFGVMALRSVNHVLGGPSSVPKMRDEMNQPRILNNRIRVWPFVHPGPTARQTYPPSRQEEGWHALKEYLIANDVTPDHGGSPPPHAGRRKRD